MIFIPDDSKNYAMGYDELWRRTFCADVRRLGPGGDQSAQPLMLGRWWSRNPRIPTAFSAKEQITWAKYTWSHLRQLYTYLCARPGALATVGRKDHCRKKLPERDRVHSRDAPRIQPSFLDLSSQEIFPIVVHA